MVIIVKSADDDGNKQNKNISGSINNCNKSKECENDVIIVKIIVLIIVMVMIMIMIAIFDEGWLNIDSSRVEMIYCMCVLFACLSWLTVDVFAGVRFM